MTNCGDTHEFTEEHESLDRLCVLDLLPIQDLRGISCDKPTDEESEAEFSHSSSFQEVWLPVDKFSECETASTVAVSPSEDMEAGSTLGGSPPQTECGGINGGSDIDSDVPA